MTFLYALNTKLFYGHRKYYLCCNLKKKRRKFYLENSTNKIQTKTDNKLMNFLIASGYNISCLRLENKIKNIS